MSDRNETSPILAFFRDRYLSIDPRILGLYRIYFGLFLCIDVLRRLPDAGLYYSNDGVISNHFSLYAPIASTLVIDPVDAHLADAVEAAGMKAVVTPSIMTTPEVARELARRTLAAVGITV